MSNQGQKPSQDAFGSYRRVYASDIQDPRINSVSLAAQLWLIRITLAADDFGNVDGHPIAVYTATVGLQLVGVSLEECTALVAQLVTAGLLIEYQVDERNYLHVDKFLETQPAGKNGKRFQRVPKPISKIQNKASASGGFQVNPDLSQSDQVNPNDSKVTQENPGVTSQSSASDKIRSDQIRLDRDHQDSPEDPQELEECNAAISAFDRWASIKPPIGIARGILSERNEHRKIFQLLEVLRETPPVIHGGAMVPQQRLVAMAIDRLINRSKEFKGIAYAISTVRGELENWSNAGVPNPKPGPSSTKSNGHQPISAVIAGDREDR